MRPTNVVDGMSLARRKTFLCGDSSGALTQGRLAKGSRERPLTPYSNGSSGSVLINRVSWRSYIGGLRRYNRSVHDTVRPPREIGASLQGQAASAHGSAREQDSLISGTAGDSTN